MKDISGIKKLILSYPESKLLKSIQDLPDQIPDSEFAELVSLWDLIAENEKKAYSGKPLRGGYDPGQVANEISVTNS